MSSELLVQHPFDALRTRAQDFKDTSPNTKKLLRVQFDDPKDLATFSGDQDDEQTLVPGETFLQTLSKFFTHHKQLVENGQLTLRINGRCLSYIESVFNSYLEPLKSGTGLLESWLPRTYLPEGGSEETRKLATSLVIDVARVSGLHLISFGEAVPVNMALFPRLLSLKVDKYPVHFLKNLFCHKASLEAFSYRGKQLNCLEALLGPRAKSSIADKGESFMWSNLSTVKAISCEIQNIDSSIGGVAMLEHLDLSRNSFRHFDMPLPPNFGTLLELNLSHNNIHSLKAFERTGKGGLQSLKILNLSFNQLNSTLGIENLTNLDDLNISHNNISSAEELMALAAIPGLVSLEARANPIFRLEAIYRQSVLHYLSPDLLLDNRPWTSAELQWYEQITGYKINEEDSGSALPTLTPEEPDTVSAAKAKSVRPKKISITSAVVGLIQLLARTILCVLAGIVLGSGMYYFFTSLSSILSNSQYLDTALWRTKLCLAFSFYSLASAKLMGRNTSTAKQSGYIKRGVRSFLGFASAVAVVYKFAGLLFPENALPPAIFSLVSPEILLLCLCIFIDVCLNLRRKPKPSKKKSSGPSTRKLSLNTSKKSAESSSLEGPAIEPVDPLLSPTNAAVIRRLSKRNLTDDIDNSRKIEDGDNGRQEEEEDEDDHKFDMQRLKQHLRVAAQSKQAIPAVTFICICNEISRLFAVLGAAMSFAADSINQYVKIMEDRIEEVSKSTSQKSISLQGLVLSEIQTHNHDAGKKSPSAARTLLRLMWFLDFVAALVGHLVNSSSDSKNVTAKGSSKTGGMELGEAAALAYQETLAPRHPWVLRKIVSNALGLAPRKETFLLAVDVEDPETHAPSAKAAISAFKESLTLLTELNQSLWGFYTEHGITELK